MWIELVSINSVRPSRRRAKWLSAVRDSASRRDVFSATRRRASVMSRVVKTLSASRRFSSTRAWKARSSAMPSAEKA